MPLVSVVPKSEVRQVGYHFSPQGIAIARRTVEKFIARVIRLYEQEPGEAYTSARLGFYKISVLASTSRRRSTTTFAKGATCGSSWEVTGPIGENSIHSANNLQGQAS